MSVTHSWRRSVNLIHASAGELAILLDDLIKRDERNLPKRSIIELRGLFKDAWDGVDAQDHINELRDEWEKEF